MPTTDANHLIARHLLASSRSGVVIPNDREARERLRKMFTPDDPMATSAHAIAAAMEDQQREVRQRRAGRLRRLAFAGSSLAVSGACADLAGWAFGLLVAGILVFAVTAIEAVVFDAATTQETR